MLLHFITRWLDKSNNPGVYRIRNKENGKVYIGATTIPMRARWKQHRGNLNCKRHKNRLFQKDWNTYGADAFEFSVIEVVRGGHDKVFERERYWQDKDYDRARRYNPRNEAVQRPYFAQTKSQIVIRLPPRFENMDALMTYAKTNVLSDRELADILSWVYRDGERMFTDEAIAKLQSRTRPGRLERPVNGW